VREQVAASALSFARTEEAATGRFRFDPGLSVFAGHFPGRPLVPGVFLVEAARLVCATALDGLDLRVAEVTRAKFSGEVSPGVEVSVAVRLSGEGPWTCRADVTAAQPVARLTLALAAAEARP
jgi:3-hydroxyacyl-[acyl-carrier-protein] dehydratase